MMDRTARLGRMGLLILATILATVVFGWAGPLFAGIVFAVLDGRRSAPAEVAVGAAVAWILVLVFTLLAAGAAPARVIGESLGTPPAVLPLASVLFAAALGWSAAAVCVALRQMIVRDRETEREPAPTAR
jgi:pheromone shutdown protein TraB